MRLFNKRNRFLEACNNVINNKKLYDSIINLQNDLITLKKSEPKIIAVVAPLNRLHSSLMAKAIAEVYAHNGKKTLLIDLDMYIPTIAKIFKLENVKNVLDIDPKNVNKVINKINDKFDVVVSKNYEYPAKFLSSDDFKNSIAQLRDRYNHILVTLPPVLDKNDILLVNELLDTVLLVSKKNETMIKEVDDSLKFIKNNNINFTGTVFIN